MEHNEDIFSCDHYVYPANRLGNILTDLPHELINSRVQAQFGRAKESALPRACRGECPKHRFLKTEQGEPGLNYLCKGYQKFFSHIDKYIA